MRPSLRRAWVGRFRLATLIVTLASSTIACGSEASPTSRPTGSTDPASAAASEATASGAASPAPSAGATTECGTRDYPCDWTAVSDATFADTRRLTDEAQARIVAGDSFTEVAAWLKADPDVATVESDDHAVRFRPIDGRPMWLIDQATFRGPTAAEQSGMRLASSRVPVTGPGAVQGSLVGGDVESKRALVLSPYFWDFDPVDSAPPAAAALEATRGYAGNVLLRLNKTKGERTVQIADFEQWDGYDVIFVSSHGARICGTDRCRAVIAAGELPTGKPLSFLQRQSLRGSGIELVTDTSGTVTMVLGADFFRIWYPNGLQDTLLIIDACQTLGPKVSDVADALRGTTSEYLGWTETVNTDVSRAATSAVLKELAKGVTVRQAYRHLGSLKDDPNTGAQFTLAGRDAGDLRTREIVSFRDASGAAALSSGTQVAVTGTPGDGKPDRVPWHVLVEGLDAEEAGATPLHVTINGSTANPVDVASGREVKPGVWLVDGEVPLTTDLIAGASLPMRASVDLVDTGTSTVEINGTVANATHATDCADILPRSDVQAAVGIDIGAPTRLGEKSALGFQCVWEDVGWELQGVAKKRPFPPSEGQLAGIPCQRSGHTATLIYCLNAERGVTGGLVSTSRWALILGTAEVSIDDVAAKIIPILDRTAN